MKKGQIKKAEKPPYEPTPMEAEALAAHKAAKEARGPRIRVSIEGGVTKVNHDHPDAFTGAVAAMRAIARETLAAIE